MEKRKRGGQPGNKNALGNRGGGAPYGNKNAEIHGLYSQIKLSHDEQDYLNDSISEREWQLRLLDIKIYRLRNKIKHWEQSTDKDGLIYIKTKRVVNLGEKIDHTIISYRGAMHLLFVAELLLQDLVLKQISLKYKLKRR